MLSTDRLFAVIAAFALSGLALGGNAHAADGIKILKDVSNQQAEDAKKAAEDKKAETKQLTAPQQKTSDIPITKNLDKASP